MDDVAFWAEGRFAGFRESTRVLPFPNTLSGSTCTAVCASLRQRTTYDEERREWSTVFPIYKYIYERVRIYIYIYKTDPSCNNNNHRLLLYIYIYTVVEGKKNNLYDIYFIAACQESPKSSEPRRGGISRSVFMLMRIIYTCFSLFFHRHREFETHESQPAAGVLSVYSSIYTTIIVYRRGRTEEKISKVGVFFKFYTRNSTF